MPKERRDQLIITCGEMGDAEITVEGWRLAPILQIEGPCPPAGLYSVEDPADAGVAYEVVSGGLPSVPGEFQSRGYVWFSEALRDFAGVVREHELGLRGTTRQGRKKTAKKTSRRQTARKTTRRKTTRQKVARKKTSRRKVAR